MTSAEVVDREEDPGDPEADEVQHDPLEDRPAGDPEHRLGDGLGQRPEPAALAAGHDDRPVRCAETGSRNSCSRCSPTGRPSPSRTGIASIRRARMSSSTSARPSTGVRRTRTLGLSERLDGLVEGRAAQQRPAQVAVGDDADQPPVVRRRPARSRRRPCRAPHRVADRAAVRGTRQASQRVSHSAASTLGAGGDADDHGARRRRRRRPRRPCRRSAPSPTVMWSRTRAPSPTRRPRRRGSRRR